MFQKILVPLDGSDLAEQALEPALALAREVAGEVILLSVTDFKQIFTEGPQGYGLTLPDKSEDLVRQDLVAYHDQLQRRWATANLTMSSLILAGDEAGTIVDSAVEHEVDLIVMSTHGRTGISRWLLGSVTEKVLQSAPCPVLVIRHAEPLAHVMITLDGSDLAETALKPGLKLARLLGSQVTLLGVEATEEFDRAFAVELERVEKGLGEQAQYGFAHRTHAYLERVAAKEQAGLEQKIQVVSRVAGPPATRIVEYIEARDVDLVVMATHGRTGLRRWIYGSVTDKVLHGAHCAIMIVRPPAEKLA